MWTSCTTPLGELRIVSEDDAVVAAEFVALPAPAATESRSVARVRAVLGDESDRCDDDPLLREAVAQFTAYFARDLEEFDLPLAPHGTAFQQRVWARLREIPYGEVATYGALARDLGMTGNAARAVGAANGRNPVAIAVPCHRVVGASGKLVGYAGGMDRKRALLALEAHALV